MRITYKDLDRVCNSINSMLDNGTRYGYCCAYGHTDIFCYHDPNSTGYSDVECGLTKSQAYSVLHGIAHVLNELKYEQR